MSKVSAETVGRMVQNVHRMGAMLDRHPDGISAIVDLRVGWNRQEKRVRRYLTHDAHVEEDVVDSCRDDQYRYLKISVLRERQSDLRAAAQTLQTAGDVAAADDELRAADEVGRQIKKIGIRKALSAAIERDSRQPVLKRAGRATRGVCCYPKCGVRLEDGEIWFDPRSSRIWCMAHGQTWVNRR